MKPMSIWFDKRVIEFWHMVLRMEDDLLVKQVINWKPGGGPGWSGQQAAVLARPVACDYG